MRHKHGAYSILGVHKPYMERRIAAAFPVYWPEMEFRVTSYQQSMEQYMTAAAARGRSQQETIDMLVGDLQRMTRYAELGYQIPQEIPDSVQSAAQALISMGYTSQMI